MLKAFAPVVTMLLLFFYKMEHCTARLVAAVLMIAAGVSMASYGELHMSVAGLAAMLVSVFSEAVRLVLTQHLLAAPNLHPLEAWVYLGPACCAWLLLQVRGEG
jgi:drug/metabolite transporter (DMT)-like permease